MQTTAARFAVAQPRTAASRVSGRVVCQAVNFDGVKKAATTFGVGLASLALTGSALAGATVKLGADNGELKLLTSDVVFVSTEFSESASESYISAFQSVLIL